MIMALIKNVENNSVQTAACNATIASILIGSGNSPLVATLKAAGFMIITLRLIS